MLIRQFHVSFLGGAPTSMCHFFTFYLKNRTSYDSSFWYTNVKWWYLQAFFFIFLNFDFLGFYLFKGNNGNSRKMFAVFSEIKLNPPERRPCFQVLENGNIGQK